MESKYYTPEIEEFHIGFKCEVHVGKFRKDGGRWDGFVLGNPTLSMGTFYDWIRDDEESKRFRVKYLDREDIESLGFVKWPDDNIYDLGEFQLHLGRHTDPYKVEIYDENDQYCFVGVIKNKNELKKVLKMIGYECK